MTMAESVPISGQRSVQESSQYPSSANRELRKFEPDHPEHSSIKITFVTTSLKRARSSIHAIRASCPPGVSGGYKEGGGGPLEIQRNNH